MDPVEEEHQLRIRVQVMLTTAIVASSVVGALVVFVLVRFLVLTPDSGAHVSKAAVVAYVIAAVVFGTVAGTRQSTARLRWLYEDRPPTPDEQRAALRVPLQLLQFQAGLWLGAAVLFGAIEAADDLRRGLQVALTVLIGGMVTCSAAYLLSEFALRPVAARAMATDPPERLVVPGVMTRSLLTWGLGSALPVIGLMFAAAFVIGDDTVSTDRLARIVLVIGGVAISAGLLVTVLAARAMVDPIASVRSALADVSAGGLDAEVEVYDGTELGLLQAGFNRMVAGLREREVLRDLFGRHVGQEVAREALAHEVQLGGEVRDVAVLFVDVIGSTELATRRPPTEVVGLLNDFFTVVVDVVDAHGGLVNKFIGDAVLAVWGAPATVDDPPGRALAAGRELAGRLATAVPELGAGIGIAAGKAVAGNVGDERRYEYTVIGDPVNEAARLTELAKNAPGRILASMAAVTAAGADEAAHWRSGESVMLRGRHEPSVLAHPDAGTTVGAAALDAETEGE